MNRKQFIKAVFLLMIIAGCATVKSPTGGPEDRTPPEVTNTTPANYSINMEAPIHIRMDFNEFIQLTNINNIVFSPLMNNQPDIKTKPKSILIDIVDTLKMNKTYTIDFGKTVTDFTEGNPAENLYYVYSTNDHIDTFSIHGTLLDAYEHTPVAEAFVMVYEQNSDSLPMLSKPDYLTKTQEDGRFSIRYIPNAKFKIFALIDNNSNYLYDLPNEKIAFSDTMIQTWYKIPEKKLSFVDTTDSLSVKDSLAMVAEKQRLDSLRMKQEQKNIHLFVFSEEEDTIQKIVDNKMIASNQALLTFNNPAIEADFELFYEENNTALDSFLIQYSHNKDSVWFWFYKNLEQSFTVNISLEEIPFDTVTFGIQKKRSGNRRNESITTPKLKLKHNLKSSFPFFKTPEFVWRSPVKRHDLSSVILIAGSDTLSNQFFFTDSSARLKMTTLYPLQENSEYQIIIPDSSFFDLRGYTNDSIIVKFTTNSKSDYSTIFLNINDIDSTSQYVVELMGKDGKPIRKNIVNGPQKLTFQHLVPKEYTIRAIEDVDRSGTWTKGNYILGRLPEAVYYYEKVLKVDANWDYEENWSVPNTQVVPR